MKPYLLLSVLLLPCLLLGEKPRYRSQYGQDRYVNEHFFQGKREGVFVDIGAHEGIRINNTYYFEKYLDWTGICVEPNPDVYQELLAYRDCICVEGCICDKYDVVNFLKITGPGVMLSGIIEFYDPFMLKRIQTHIDKDGATTEVIQVKCYALMDLLKEHNITHIDYLSIDTEGGELEILKSIDYSIMDIDVIGVENNRKAHPIAEFLVPQGYKKVATLGCDEIYKKI